MRALAIVVVSLVPCACTVDLVVPAGAGIACTSDDACPDGFLCSTSLQRCVAPGGSGPIAISPTIAPDWASAGTEVVAEFTTAEPMASVPEVELQTTPARSFTYVSLTADRYAFSYTVAGDETEGAFAITATLDNGSERGTSALGQITFDFTPPTGSGSRSGDTFGSGDTIGQSLGASEPLGQHPSVVIASTPAIALALITHDGTSYGYEHTFDGSEPTGTWSVIATLLDRAGNEGTVDLGTVTITP